MPFISDACSGSRRSVRPITLAVRSPENGPSARIAASTAGCGLPPIAQPTTFRIARLASCRTSSGILVKRVETMYEARALVSDMELRRGLERHDDVSPIEEAYGVR